MRILQATWPLRIRQNRITWNRKPCEGYKPWVHHTNTILHLGFACKVVGKNHSNAPQMVVKNADESTVVKSFKNSHWTNKSHCYWIGPHRFDAPAKTSEHPSQVHTLVDNMPAPKAFKNLVWNVWLYPYHPWDWYIYCIWLVNW